MLDTPQLPAKLILGEKQAQRLTIVSPPMPPQYMTGGRDPPRVKEKRGEVLVATVGDLSGQADRELRRERKTEGGWEDLLTPEEKQFLDETDPGTAGSGLPPPKRRMVYGTDGAAIGSRSTAGKYKGKGKGVPKGKVLPQPGSSEAMEVESSELQGKGQGKGKGKGGKYMGDA